VGRVLDIRKLEGQGRRLWGLLVLGASGGGDPAQHQQDGPLLLVAAAKHQDRVGGQLIVGDHAVRLEIFGREVVAQ
jgi:hypothetical protein